MRKQRTNHRIPGAGALFLAFVAVFIAGAAAQAEKEPARTEMTLAGGRMGDVFFPHLLHEENLKDCKACHDLYPEEKDAIGRLKAEGKLKSQQAMRVCTSCHIERRKEDRPHGPVKCRDCHNK